MQGFGRVDVEPDEPVFHHQWEARTFALAGGALGAGGFNTSMFRHAIERMEPAHYLASSYYEHWLTAVTTLLTESGAVTTDELEARVNPFPRSLPARVTGDDLSRFASAAPAPATPFAVGDRVRVRDVRFAGHSRCPAYVRGRVGTIVARGPDAPRAEDEAHLGARVMEPTYTVRFDAAELWPGEAEPNTVVVVDLYAHYLTTTSGDERDR
jgi:nitrile hydratase subunit beta